MNAPTHIQRCLANFKLKVRLLAFMKRNPLQDPLHLLKEDSQRLRCCWSRLQSYWSLCRVWTIGAIFSLCYDCFRYHSGLYHILLTQCGQSLSRLLANIIALWCTGPALAAVAGNYSG